MEQFEGFATIAVIFAAFWLLAEVVCALLSGWFELARRFPDPAPDAPRPHTSDWLYFGRSQNLGYRYYPRISVDRNGLHLAARWPAGIIRHAIAVPWESVDRRGSYGWWLFRREAYGIGFHSVISFRAGSRAARLVDEYLAVLQSEADHR
jgi:hypothetical protein